MELTNRPGFREACEKVYKAQLEAAKFLDEKEKRVYDILVSAEMMEEAKVIEYVWKIITDLKLVDDRSDYEEWSVAIFNAYDLYYGYCYQPDYFDEPDEEKGEDDDDWI